MSDTPAADAAAKPKKKKSGMKKLLMMVGVPAVLIGGGVAGGVYASGAGLLGGHGSTQPAAPNGPHLLPKSDQVRAAPVGADGAESHGSGSARTWTGQGGDQYASTYYRMENDFTSNIQDSSHFVQVGIAVSTHYDDSVIENLRTNEIAVRSAILMTLGDTPEDQVITSDGKRMLQRRLVQAINQVLQEREGFGGISNVYFTNFVVQ